MRDIIKGKESYLTNKDMKDIKKINNIFYNDLKPYDAISMANKMNVDVYFCDFSKIDSNITGFINNKNGKFSIYVNENCDEKTKNITIGHELGHFLFDDNDYEGYIACRDIEKINKKDYEENKIEEIGLEIIMPSYDFKNNYNIFKNSGMDNSRIISKLSDLYCIPKSNIVNRMNALGVL